MHSFASIFSIYFNQRFPSTMLKKVPLFGWLVGIMLAGLITSSAVAQRQLVQVTGIPPLREGAHAGGDFDGDGDEDVMVTGRHADGTIHTVLYRFLRRRVVQVTPLAKPTVFADYQQVPFLKTSVFKGSVTWYDVDRDNRLDLIVTGLAVSGFTPNNTEIQVPNTSIYLNRGSDAFSISPNHGLPAIYDSQVAAADFNNDGIVDIVMGGRSSNGLVLGVWMGRGNQRYEPSSNAFEGLQVSSISVADVDRDGDADFMVSGINEKGQPRMQLYVNNGQGLFSPYSQNLPNLYFGATAFGDIDYDGDLDLLINGGQLGPAIMRGQTFLFQNNGSGGFTQVPTTLPGLYGGGVSLKDLDRDGDADLFSWGIESLDRLGSEKVIVAENIDRYLLQIGSAQMVLNGAVAVFDYDGNGRKDVFLSGDLAGDRSMFIYEF